ncbi:PREDICTED: uncharacterized protein LOC104612540 [Nelumbo nucifera]|uniref:Uncharacterized protein LOC104612540 n=1 Tax=Nelumbo nucifera TaxID=4432 RepID=A0A1U8BE94_NELNU|nr:PREDICTED: uncharacterized protein LOC104612540 [Nelumbo nucifera]
MSISSQVSNSVNNQSSIVNLNLPLTITHLISIKLDRNNYLLWRSQFIPVLKGFKALGYVDEPISALPKFVKDKEGVLAQVIEHATSSKSIWDALARLFAFRSNARVMQLRFELSHLKKGNQCMADYIQKVRLISNSLAATGGIISDSELIQYVLGRLGPDFESLVTIIMVRSNGFTFDYMQALLLNHEIRVEHTKLCFDNYHPIANVASRYDKAKDTKHDVKKIKTNSDY